MTNTSKFMQLLARVMRSKNMGSSMMDKEKYNKLYYMIYSEFNSMLQRSSYPHIAETIQKFKNMMNDLESLYLFPEIIGKRCILVSSYKTSNLFSVCGEMFLKQEFIVLFHKIHTQIPFLVVSGEENAIEILNYANVRVSLTLDEFKFLIIESGKRKIALNKIVQYIFVKTKLTDSGLCLIFDNIYGKAEYSFNRSVSKRIAYINETDMKSIEKRRLKGFSALITDDEIMLEIERHPYLKKFSRIGFNDISSYINEEVKLVLYGFLDEFTFIDMKIQEYYESQKIQTKIVLQGIVSDIVRLEDKMDYTLQSIKKYEEGREEKIISDSKEIGSGLQKIGALVTDICNDLGENYIIGKEISRLTLNNIFDSIFLCRTFTSGRGKKLLSRLYSFEYNNYDLVSVYAQMVSGTKETYNLINIGQDEWEKAKMLIFILEPDKIPEKYLEKYIQILGDRCTTGKELYAKALISPERIKGDLLQESFEKGYEKAGLELLERYKKGDRSVNLLSLANALIPEACMIIADDRLYRHKSRKNFADLSDREFAYYKIAATKQYFPAIGKIVDTLFGSRFSTGFQIPHDDLYSNKYKEMIENGKAIIQLSQFLIDKMYQVEHYSEILGIVLFALNENLSYAMNLLAKAKSGLAYYCKGNMYEFGGGVSIDLEKAIYNYEKAIYTYEKGMQKRLYERAEKRLEACNGKLSKKIYYENRDNYYQSNRTYNSTSRTTDSYSYSEGCFPPGTRIFMADGEYRKVEMIKAGDMVMAYNHYKGEIIKEKIIANVHDFRQETEFNIISMKFENEKTLSIVKSHILFNFTEKRYVWIDDENIKQFLGHEFAVYEKGGIKGYRLLDYFIESKMTYYYVPISKYHMNVFAEGFLTMPPTKLTENMFPIKKDLCYDLSIMNQVKKTAYEEIKDMVSKEEYSELPCEYLSAVMALKRCNIKDFEHIMMLYRDQSQYFFGVD